MEDDSCESLTALALRNALLMRVRREDIAVKKAFLYMGSRSNNFTHFFAARILVNSFV